MDTKKKVYFKIPNKPLMYLSKSYKNVIVNKLKNIFNMLSEGILKIFSNIFIYITVLARNI